LKDNGTDLMATWTEN